MTPLPPSPFEFNSAMSSQGADTAAVAPAPGPMAAAVTLSESAAPLPARESAPTPAAGSTLIPEPAAFSVSDIQHIPELIRFSEYAAERCKDIISPPRKQSDIDRIGLRIVSAALNLHPRDLDNDPPPLFLRKPRPAFLRALFELGGTR